MAPISSTTSHIPSTQTAVVAGPDGQFCISKNHPVIAIEPDTIIIRTVAVALNPVDTKLAGDFVTPGVTFGFDCAGVVVAIGPDVKKDLKIGDRVCGSAAGMDKSRPSGGALVEYAALLGDVCLRIPDNMSFEDAATVGVAINSAALALFSSLKIDWNLLEKPTDKPFPVLVYGGSTAVGTMAIQFLKLCGLRPITTCSPKNFDLVKSYGAEEAWDYRSPTCAQDIRAYCKNALMHAFDCITEETSMTICYAAIGRAGGRYCALDPYPPHAATRKVVKPDWVVAFTITGRPCLWPAPFESPAHPEMLEWSVPMYKVLEKFLAEGKVRTHPARVSKGFEAILDGVGILRRKEVSGEKLVFTVG